MTDQSTIDPEASAAPAEPVASTAAAPEPAPAAPEPDPLDQALAEFDIATAREADIDKLLASIPGGVPQLPRSPEEVQAAIAQQRELYDLQRNSELATQRNAELEAALLEMQHAELHRQDVAETDRLVAEFDAKLKDFVDLPRDYALSWLKARSVDDVKAFKAFHNRRADPRGWAREQERLALELQKEVRERPDRELTEDRNAVIAAVRGASSSSMPHEPEPDLSNLNNAQYTRYVREKYGISTSGI